MSRGELNITMIRTDVAHVQHVQQVRDVHVAPFGPDRRLLDSTTRQPKYHFGAKVARPKSTINQESKKMAAAPGAMGARGAAESGDWAAIVRGQGAAQST